MPSRRVHVKTRNGCAQCKKRRVKCDGAPPRCSNCVRRNEACSFNNDWHKESINHTAHHRQGLAAVETCTSSPTNKYRDSSLSTLSSSAQGSSALQSPRQRLFLDPSTLKDTALLHHYATITAPSLWRKDELRPTWEQFFVLEAYNDRAVMQSLLSLAAVHLCHLLPAQQKYYGTVARSHHTQALQLATLKIPSVSKTNCHTVFASINLIALLTFIQPSEREPSATEVVNNMIDFVSLLRGISIVTQGAKTDLETGRYSTLLDRDWYTTAKSLSGEIENQFQILDHLNETSSSESRRSIYAIALCSLKHAFATFVRIAEDEGMMGVWPSTLELEFVCLLRQRDSFALAILAQYAVLLQSIEGLWWIEGRGKQLIHAIADLLSSSWQAAIAWPLQVVRRNGRLSVQGDMVQVSYS